MARGRFKPIADYAVIGDCRSAALIARDASIDWLCWPRFDSPSLLAALLDPDVGGSWELSPVDVVSTTRSYLDDTNVLRTEFTTRTGACAITDCMPVTTCDHRPAPHLAEHEILRKIECTAGEVQLSSRFWPHPNYATGGLKYRYHPVLGTQIDLGRGGCWFRSSQPHSTIDAEVRCNMVLGPHQTEWLSLSFADVSPAVLPPLGPAAQRRLSETVGWWRRWSSRISYSGVSREAVLRSALVLKLMTYAPSGAIVAAPTTSLPERIGGSLNWDYRYCWLRDASLTVRALLGLEYHEEAAAFIDWMCNSTSLTLPRLSVLYDVYGNRPRKEYVARQFAGYEKSYPVRIGNAAINQLQLDVYGEVIDGVAQFLYHDKDLDRSSRKTIEDMGKYVLANWNLPDDGIWEPRGARHNHTHSRLLCWTALDRIVTMIDNGVLSNLQRQPFIDAREQIRRQILEDGWNSELQSYTGIYQGHRTDASLLLMPWYGFEKPDSQRMLSTYRQILRELRVGRNLLYRYQTSPPEGAFGICCFWEADFLALGGAQLQDASAFFESLLPYANDVGLFAEEIDPFTGAPVGNFPQAFTHVGLISAALSLEDRCCGADQLGHHHHARATRGRAA